MLPKVSVPFNFSSCTIQKKKATPPPPPCQVWRSIVSGHHQSVHRTTSIRNVCRSTAQTVSQLQQFSLSRLSFYMCFTIRLRGLQLLWFTKYCKRLEQILLSRILTPVAPPKVNNFTDSCKSHVNLSNTNTSVFNVIRTSTTVIVLYNTDCFLLHSRDLTVSLTIICESAMKSQLHAWEDYSRSWRDSKEKQTELR